MNRRNSHFAPRKAIALLMSCLMVTSSYGGMAKIGQPITVTVTATSFDPNEAAEGEGFTITSTGGYSQVVPFPFGSVTISFNATIDGELVKVIPYLDGDETYTVTITGADRAKAGVDPKANNGDQGCPPMSGNPINSFTGNKFQRATDIERAGQSLLEFVRYYNSDGSALDTGDYPGVLAAHWRHTYSRYITRELDDTLHLVSVRVERPDGASIQYMPNGSGGWTSSQDPLGRLTQLPGGGWRYLSAANVLEDYSAGILSNSSSTPPFHQLQSLTYPSGYKQAVQFVGTTSVAAGIRDSYGRTLTFASAPGLSRLTSVTDSAGHVWRYSTIGSSGSVFVENADLLSKAQFFDTPQAGTPTSVIGYNYGETGYQELKSVYFPDLLTSIVDENGDRFASFYYDHMSRAILTKHGLDANETSIAFADGNSSDVSDASGKVTNNYVTIGGLARTSGSSRPAGSGCLASSNNVAYTPAGTVSLRDDFNGNRTCYAYNALNQETARIEGLVNSAACASTLASSSLPTGSRKLTTTWHPDWNLPVQATAPKLLTTYVYNGQPDPSAGGVIATCAPTDAQLPDGKPIAVLCKQIEQATTDVDGSQGASAPLDASVPPRVTSMTYNMQGQLLTVKDPLGHTTQSVYYADTTTDHTLGDLQSMTNAVGHVTQFLKYDPMGRILRKVEPNGSTLDMIYNTRGWPTSMATTPSGGGTTRTTFFAYDGVGQVKLITLFDGTTTKFDYDQAHRLVRLTDAAANTVSYVLDGAGNRIGEERRDPLGNLTRQTSRVFDALNRLQKITGSAQ